MNLLCADFKRAADNREMVRLKLNIRGYLEIEERIRKWPRRIPLPENLIGRIPSLGQHEMPYGMHEVNE